MKDLGAAKKILEMEFMRDKKAKKLYLSMFNMHNVKPVSTSLASHFKLLSALYPQLDDDIYVSSSLFLYIWVSHVCNLYSY